MGLSKLNMNYFNHGTKFCNADINWFPKIETTINIKLMIKTNNVRIRPYELEYLLFRPYKGANSTNMYDDKN